MLIQLLFKSFSALQHGYIWKIALLSLLLTLMLLTGFIAGTGILLAMFTGAADGGLVQSTVGWLGAAGAGFLSYFLAPLLFPLVSILFLDGIVTHIEQRYYNIHHSRSAPLSSTLPATLFFIGKAVLINLLALPFYWIPGMYYLVNGYLYGREYFELVALRHHTMKDTSSIRKHHSGTVMMGGVLIIIMFTIPFLNLIAPILATVYMVHIYHRLNPATQEIARGEEPRFRPKL